MKKKTQRILVIVLAAVMLLSVLGPLLSALADATVTQSQISNMKNQISDISAQRAQAQRELNAIRGDMSKAERQVEIIQANIISIEEEIRLSWMLLDEYDLEIQAKEENIAKLEAQEAAQYSEFCTHVRWVEETGSVSYLSILFKAGSFSELLDYFTLIGDIMDYSNRIIHRLQQTRAELDSAKEELEAARGEQAEAHELLNAQLEELEQQELEAEKIYDEIAKSEKVLAAKARQLAADEAAMKNELSKAEKAYAAQIAALNNNTGAWYWPLPGQYYISSVFGGRTSPITGRWESHTGTDIPASGGTEIHAAQGGIVTVSGWNNSYGNYCIISHGNGYATLYAHQRKLPIVKVGQTVSKGQVIGYVGSTGNSTGNHLHFELRINGVRDNVLKLYPNLPYTGPYVNIIKNSLKK